jgi:hypothetical protein
MSVNVSVYECERECDECMSCVYGVCCVVCGVRVGY